MIALASVAVMHSDIDQVWLDSAFRAKYVAWDIETTGLDWAHDTIGTVQLFVPGKGTVIVQPDAHEVPGMLLRLLNSPRVTKVFHHAPFDLRFMVSKWTAVPANIACTKVAAKIVWPGETREFYSLKPLTHRLLGIELDKSQQRSDWAREILSRDQVRYAAADVENLLPLLNTILERAERKQLEPIIRSSFDYLPTRVALDIAGVGDVFTY